MGAGHDGAARELQKRLVARGHEVSVVDYLRMVPLRLGGFVRWTYLVQLRLAPWSYDLTYKALGAAAPILWSPVVWLMSIATRRALQAQLRTTRPDAIVSTYPLASLVLGRMRKKGWLRVPVATYLTDFAVHPLWVHPGVDVHLAVSPISAETAARRGGHDNRAAGPLVAEQFRAPRGARDEIRHRLGVGPDERAVLVVAGSWGIGDVGETVRAIAGCGDYHPITVCGRDEKLRASLVEQGLGGTILGWTDEMPGLMAASDALVENAGGLTAMEAFAAGLPVVTFHPIAGHGKDNAKYMSGSGVSRYARNDAELQAALATATTPGSARDAMIAAARALFAGDPTDDVVELAAQTRADQLVVPFQPPRLPRRVAVATGGLLALYLALTLGAQGVSALGVGIAKAPKNETGAVYVGVRVDAKGLNHARVTDAIVHTGASVVVDGLTALHTGPRLAALARRGVDVANGGWGEGRFLRWNRAHDDCDKSGDVIAARIGRPAHEFVPGRHFDAFDQLYCRTGKHHQTLVQPNEVFRPREQPEIQPRHVYLFDSRGDSPRAVLNTLNRFERRVDHGGLEIRSLQELN
jgi:UDP-N-acetylglucosamine:LPS N-acetylglucosamine transferase